MTIFSSIENLSSDFTLLLELLLLVVAAIMMVIAIAYRQKAAIIKGALNKITKSFQDLDEQAKLIIKTDLELSRTQEELDKRFSGLNALQKISRLVSTTLIENEIFERLNQPLLTELGFEKYLIITWDKQGNPFCRLQWEFIDVIANQILRLIKNNSALLTVLQKNHILAYDETTRDQDRIIRIPDIKQFVMAPILTQDKVLGLILAAKNSKLGGITEADKEVVSILADQVGQAMRNARLFEEVFLSHQSLELKVDERTRQLSNALEDVQKISKMKSEFISAVSHELRTPLTSIKGYASILMAGKVGKIPPEVKDRLAKINKHSDNLVKMINELLDISRIESGRVSMRYTLQHIQPVIENIRDLLTPQIKEKELDFKVQIAENMPPVMMDPAQIERVFINLVSNAIKFTPHHGKITIEAEHDEQKITVKVSDSGIGIKSEDLERLFDEFYRADNLINQSVKGTGLGLSLAKKIIEAHGGKIWVTSRLDQGTHFYFTLPVEQQKDPKP